MSIKDKPMIICSCNVFSDHQLRSIVATATQRPRMSQIYDNLGSSAQCGRCAHTIKRIMEEIPSWVIGPATASANLHTRPRTSARAPSTLSREGAFLITDNEGQHIQSTLATD
jgi:bacterioferritin-associated ferredoxin